MRSISASSGVWSSEQLCGALEDRTRGGERELLSHHLEEQHAKGVHRGKLRQPGARIEIRMLVDQARDHRIGPAKVASRRVATSCQALTNSGGYRPCRCRMIGPSVAETEAAPAEDSSVPEPDALQP
jgi:hypothetical protein